MSTFTSLQELQIHPFFKIIDIDNWDIIKFLTWKNHEYPIRAYQKVNLHRVYKDSIRTILDSNPHQNHLEIITKYHHENISVSVLYLIVLYEKILIICVV